MAFKMVSFEIESRTGGTLRTTAQFIPLSAKFKGESLFLYGMLSDDLYDQPSHAGRRYEVCVYGGGDAVDPDFGKEHFVDTLIVGDADSGERNNCTSFVDGYPMAADAPKWDMLLLVRMTG